MCVQTLSRPSLTPWPHARSAPRPAVQAGSAQSPEPTPTGHRAQQKPRSGIQAPPAALAAARSAGIRLQLPTSHTQQVADC